MRSLEKKPYSWNQLMTMILSHRRELAIANLIAVLGAVTAVPVPLLIPLLVDEVLLQKPGSAVSFMNSLFPENWHGPILYITAITLLTLFLRLLTLIFGVWQTREFTLISKEVIFGIRRSLLQRLGRISMSEYETLGAGKVASHLVTDLQSIDIRVMRVDARIALDTDGSGLEAYQEAARREPLPSFKGEVFDKPEAEAPEPAEA